MTIKFLLLVNKQGQTRLAKYFTELLSTDEKRALEGEIVRKCLARTDKQCSFFEHRSYKIIYRRYASLFFMVGVDDDENELAVLELIHCFVEVLDKHFGQVCELDIMNDPDVVSSSSSLCCDMAPQRLSWQQKTIGMHKTCA
eukprot:GHRR01031902.1.p1 GENE.GHRR01031902.1~~GHRR01031902.1.p1  ORF type:complete len:142 (+),score=32.16 GHRR01031902.1:244-669(+)